MFLNLPFESPLGETGPEHTTLIPSNQYLIAIAAFALGLSDSCFNTQVNDGWLLNTAKLPMVLINMLTS